MKLATTDPERFEALRLLFDGESGGFIKCMIAVAVAAGGIGLGFGLAFSGYGYSQRLMHGERPVTVYESKVCPECGAHPGREPQP